MTENTQDFVTVTVGGQMFGLPILRVQDVFMPARMTKVPLAPPEIAGLINMRGRIVTIVDMRVRLGLDRAETGTEPMAVGVEQHGESYGLRVDAVGEVLKLEDARREANPVNLDPRLARVACGVHRVDDRLLVLLDIDRVLDINATKAAA